MWPRLFRRQAGARTRRGSGRELEATSGPAAAFREVRCLDFNDYCPRDMP